MLWCFSFSRQGRWKKSRIACFIPCVCVCVCYVFFFSTPPTALGLTECWWVVFPWWADCLSVDGFLLNLPLQQVPHPRPGDLAGPVACERSREDREMIAGLSFTYMYLSRGGSNYEVRALRLFAVRGRKKIHKKCGMSVGGQGGPRHGVPLRSHSRSFGRTGLVECAVLFSEFPFSTGDLKFPTPAAPSAPPVANLFWHALKSSTFRPSSTVLAVLRMDEVGEWMCVCVCLFVFPNEMDWPFTV